MLLHSPRLLPFLWDLDAAAIDEITPSYTLPLDWELLARTPSQPVVRHADEYQHDPSTEVATHCYDWLYVPNGLRNWRRIWQLVEEIGVRDVLPRAWPYRQLVPDQDEPREPREPLPAWPRYWDEDGEPMHPISRMLCVIQDEAVWMKT